MRRSSVAHNSAVADSHTARFQFVACNSAVSIAVLKVDKSDSVHSQFVAYNLVAGDLSIVLEAGRLDLAAWVLFGSVRRMGRVRLIVWELRCRRLVLFGTEQGFGILPALFDSSPVRLELSDYCLVKERHSSVQCWRLLAVRCRWCMSALCYLEELLVL